MRQRRNTLAVQQQKDEISNRTDSEYYNDHDDHLKSSAHDAPKKNVQSTIIVDHHTANFCSMDMQ